jgi:hypothetical protein
MFRPGTTIITTVISAATSRDLVAFEDVVDDWGIADDAATNFLARAISRCSRSAENFCNRTFALEAVQDEIALPHDGWPHVARRETSALQLSRWPVASVLSVDIDGTALAEGVDFQIDADSGQLVRLDASGNPKDWTGILTTVTYSAGYWLPGMTGTMPTGAKALPDDIADAVSRMVYTRYAERQRDPLVKSEYIDGVGRTEYILPSSDGNLSPDVLDILDNYRVPVIA